MDEGLHRVDALAVAPVDRGLGGHQLAWSPRAVKRDAGIAGPMPRSGCRAIGLHHFETARALVDGARASPAPTRTRTGSSSLDSIRDPPVAPSSVAVELARDRGRDQAPSRRTFSSSRSHHRLGDATGELCADLDDHPAPRPFQETQLVAERLASVLEIGTDHDPQLDRRVDRRALDQSRARSTRASRQVPRSRALLECFGNGKLGHVC